MGLTEADMHNAKNTRRESAHKSFPPLAF